MPNPMFENKFTTLQKQIIGRLSEIEQEDADACANCGGEDCACCEIYQDRQKWQSPEDLFSEDELFADEFERRYMYRNIETGEIYNENQMVDNLIDEGIDENCWYKYYKAI